MNYIDIIIVFFVGLGFILGYKDGLVRKLIGLAGFVISLLLALELSSFVGKLLTPIINNEYYLAQLIATMLIFIAGILITSVIKRVVHPIDKLNNFLNQLLGGFAGMLQIIFFLSIAFILLNIFHFPKEETKNSSLLYTKTTNVVPGTTKLFFGDKDKLKNMVIKFIQSKDTSVIGTDN